MLRNDDGLFEFLCCDINDYDIHRFRNWNDYEYYFDTSACGNRPEIYGSIVRVYEKETKKEVWKLGIGIKGRFLVHEEQ